MPDQWTSYANCWFCGEPTDKEIEQQVDRHNACVLCFIDDDRRRKYAK